MKLRKKRLNSHTVISILIMTVVFFIVSILTDIIIRPALSSDQFYTQEVVFCTPIGGIAMTISKLRKSGHEQNLIEQILRKKLDQNLSLWVTPLTKIVFSEPEKATEKVVKQAIKYCLRSLKAHQFRQEVVNSI